MRAKQHFIGSIVAMIAGIGLCGVGVATEFLSSSPDGIGPYQAILIVLGGLIIILSLLPIDHIISKISVLAIGFVVSLMIVEGLLLIMSRANVVVTFPDTRELVDDDILGKRTPPDAVGHDARGWRNRTALTHADIVVIGDSQTWGVNATLAQAYPSVLADLSGFDVYSMAQGSYGAVQYRVLAEQAVDLSPQLVIIGMYFGNDFVDAYSIVYGDYAYQDLRNPVFNMTTITQTIAEQARPLQPEGLINTNQQPEQLKQVKLTFWERVQSGTYIGKFLTWVGVFDVVNTGAMEQQTAANSEVVENSPELFAWYRNNTIQTFLTPAYRQLVLDLDSPMIQEGIHISKQQYAEMQDNVAQNDIELLVVLIPTKEYVYAPFFGTNELNKAYQLLVSQETQIREDMMGFFAEIDIAYVDTLPALQEAVNQGVSIYPPTFDGHPIANGYQIIAEVIANFIEANNLMK